MSPEADRHMHGVLVRIQMIAALAMPSGILSGLNCALTLEAPVQLPCQLYLDRWEGGEAPLPGWVPQLASSVIPAVSFSTLLSSFDW